MKLIIKMLTCDGWKEISIDDCVFYGVPQELLEDVLFNKKNREYAFKPSDNGYLDGIVKVKLGWH